MDEKRARVATFEEILSARTWAVEKAYEMALHFPGHGMLLTDMEATALRLERYVFTGSFDPSEKKASDHDA